MIPEHEEYINRCVAIGAAAAREGNSPVGALIIKDGIIISEAGEANYTKNDVTCHAEIDALRSTVRKLGRQDLSDCTLYTSHEPCVMCSYVIRFHRIRKVVFLHRVPYLGGVSSSMPLLISVEVPPDWGDKPEVICME
jgi:tRNA(adenine34) deaminase